jgi:RNA polymerase sigma factor (sigma-70 family)
LSIDGGHPSPSFLPTRWSLVLAAKRRDAAAARALEDLARTYWYPLYAYARRRGISAPDAEDLIQSFFAALLEKHALATVDPAKGRFRSFLLAALQHFIVNEFDKASAQKRGGHLKTQPLEIAGAEARYCHEPIDNVTPEKLFERRWALSILDQVLARLEQDYAGRHEQKLFTLLCPLLTAEEITGGGASYRDIAKSLDTTEGAVKTAAHRLRRRYRDLLREEIAHTVATPEEVEEEIAYLLKCL